jgi:hypothetical protein
VDSLTHYPLLLGIGLEDKTFSVPFCSFSLQLTRPGLSLTLPYQKGSEKM